MSVIMISGKAGSGKDTVCDMLIKKLTQKGKQAQRFAMADQLKVFCDRMYQDLKQYMTLKYPHIDNSLKAQPQSMRFRRKWWLSVGKHVKKSFGHLAWVDAVFEKTFVKDALTCDSDNFAIITDMRFHNEYIYARSHTNQSRIKLLRIFRPGPHPIAGYLGTSEQLANDASQTDLDKIIDWHWDFLIKNDFDLKSLQNKVEEVINKLLI